MGRRSILSERGMRIWHKYVLQYCTEPFNNTVQRFNGATGYKICEKTGRRYVRKLKMDSFVAIQKPYLSNKNCNARIV